MNVQMDRLPTEAEWQDWLDHPATKAQLRLLRKWKEEAKEQWAAGAFTDLSQYGTAILNAKAIGGCELIENVLDLTFEQVIGELGDG